MFKFQNLRWWEGSLGIFSYSGIGHCIFFNTLLDIQTIPMTLNHKNTQKVLSMYVSWKLLRSLKVSYNNSVAKRFLIFDHQKLFIKKKKKKTVAVKLHLHTGQCKSTGGYYTALASALFRTGAGEIAIPTVIIMFVRA